MPPRKPSAPRRVTPHRYGPAIPPAPEITLPAQDPTLPSRIRKTWLRAIAIYLAETAILTGVSLHRAAANIAALAGTHASPWPPDAAGADNLFALTTSAGAFILYAPWAMETDLTVAFTVIFIGLSSVLYAVARTTWLCMVPMALGIIFIAILIIAVLAGNAHPAAADLVDLELDPATRIVTDWRHDRLSLCAAGIRVDDVSAARGGETQNVEILEGGAVYTLEYFDTAAPADAIVALIRQKAASSGCPIPDEAVWP